MPWATAAVIGGIAELGGGLLAAKGQRDTNRMNWKIAQKQMQFQERMSNTAYQRASSDLEAAGLNRILAVGSPASTPVGARAQMENPNAALASGISRSAATALAVRRAGQEINNLKAIEGREQSQTDLNRANEDLIAEDIQNRRVSREREIAQTVRELTQAANINVNTALTSQHIPGAKAEADLWRRLETMNAEEVSKAFGMGIPAAKSLLMGLRMLRGGQ